ncbi:MAG: hypothetical protein NTX03_08670, partial [Bacteroidetes bacterium]|nr:hypothetical protein [Bacteroidota bacterium]
SLTPTHKTQWGKRNVNQGIRHMNMALDIPTGDLDPTIAKKPPMPKWLLKFFLLNAKPPKGGAETFKEMNMVANGINPDNFEKEKADLLQKVDAFSKKKDGLIPENKIAGKFSRDDWGKLTYNHMDHHLRQFGA